MNKLLYHGALALGLAAVGWIGARSVGANPLALTMTALIGAFYAMGALELHRFRRATASLGDALGALREPPTGLGAWLDRIDASLQNAVRLRIEGERVGLPAPAMTPYLTGLLVLLGMMGTFLGMVVTLNGTGQALQTATDVQAVRASLSAPVQGLGLAFGTSLAGVAASAMLGLMSALARRERLQAGQLLDTKIATTLRAFSLTHQREASFELLQRQAALMPELVGRLEAMMDRLEQQHAASQQQLLAGQERFHREAEAAYGGLAASVDRTLQHSLVESARVAGATIQPVVEATMAGIAREAGALQASVADQVQRQLLALNDRFEASTSTVAGLWQAALAEHQRAGTALSQQLRDALAGFTDTFEQRAAALVQGVDRAHGELQTQLVSQDELRLAAFTEVLQRTAHGIAAQAEAQATRTVAEIGTLMQTAAEAPRAAAAVIAELREQLSASVARDNAVLDERNRLMETLGTLLDAVNHASHEQRGAIDALVASSADVLERVGARFAEQVGVEADKMGAVAAQVTGSAVEVASLGEAFGEAVTLFSQSNEQLTSHLQRIEAALAKSLARSDEQLAYYVAQARELIDLSLMSQKQIVENLQQIAGARVPVVDEA